jgi:hypothetical protein
MRHQDATINHRLESWVFANAAARNAAGSYVAADVGRIGYQTDTGDYWRLLSATPTWKRLNGAYAAVQTAQYSPAAITSVTGVMAGMGAVITPTVSGKILVTIAGTLSNTAAHGTTAQMRWGTGSAPAYGAAPIGTPVGAMAGGNDPDAWSAPFSLSAVVLNAVIGQPIWFDLVLGTVAGGSAGFFWLTATITEIP